MSIDLTKCKPGDRLRRVDGEIEVLRRIFDFDFPWPCEMEGGLTYALNGSYTGINECGFDIVEILGQPAPDPVAELKSGELLMRATTSPPIPDPADEPFGPADNREAIKRLAAEADELSELLGIGAEIEDTTAHGHALAGNVAKANWHAGKSAGLRQAQSMLAEKQRRAGK